MIDWFRKQLQNVVFLLVGIEATNDVNKDKITGLEVIGIGFPRTGTSTLKSALTILNYKTYHQSEAIQDFKKLESWENILNTKIELKNKYGINCNDWYDDKYLIEQNDIDFHEIYLKYGYNAALCVPTYIVFKEIIKKYPNIKVILTIRDENEWYESVLTAIFPFRKCLDRWQLVMFGGKKFATFFDNAFYDIMVNFKINKDKKYCIQQYKNWNKMVKHYVCAQQLLEYHPHDGWEPLCKFLNKPIPKQSFPRTNSKQRVIRMRKIVNIFCDIINILIIVFVSCSFWFLYKRL